MGGGRSEKYGVMRGCRHGGARQSQMNRGEKKHALSDEMSAQESQGSDAGRSGNSRTDGRHREVILQRATERVYAWYL